MTSMTTSPRASGRAPARRTGPCGWRTLAALTTLATMSAVTALPTWAADAAPAPKRGRAHPPTAAASALAEAAAVVPVDPVDQLRERLAQRLAAVKLSSTASPHDLKLPARTPPAAVKTTAPQAAASVKAPKAGSAQGTAHGSALWAYSGDVGPQAWGGLKPEFGLCAKGERQSPIDIREGIAVDLEPIQFHYQPGAFAVIDSGHTVQVNVAPGNSIELGGRRFELLQFHFHRPSEERIDGRQFDLSVHLVHRDADGRLAVVGVLLGRGSVHPVVQTVWNNLPLERYQEAQVRATLDPSLLLPADKAYYTYMGSLTTPPCSEGVQWVVLRQPVTASVEQIDIFARLYPMNARPVQSASGRRILQSN